MTFLCGGCGEEKPPSDFYVKYRQKRAERRSDWSGNCIECMKEYKRQYYLKNSTKVNEYHKRKRLEHYEQYLEKEAARRLARSQNQGALLNRRRIQSLSYEAQYLHKRVLQWKRSARDRNLEWNLEQSDIELLLHSQKRLCHYTQTPLAFEAGKSNTISLDRVDSSKGYTTDNVVLCGTMVNLMKLDMTRAEFREVITKLHQNPNW